MEKFSYDGVDITDVIESSNGEFIIRNTSGRGVMSKVNSTTSIAGLDGSRFIDSVFPERTISISYVMRGNNFSHLLELEELLTRVLTKTEPKPLAFLDQVGSYQAILDSVSASQDLGRIQTGTITFLCPDPFRTRQRVVTPRQFLDANTNLQIENNGNWQTPLTIDILTMTATPNPIVITVNGQSMTFTPTESIVAGTSMVINSDTQEFHQGNLLKVLEVEGHFPVLRSGLNTVQINIATNLSLSFTERDI